MPNHDRASEPLPLSEPLLLKVSEAAALARVCRTKAYALVKAGTWPSIRMGGSVRIPLVDLRIWIAGNTTGGLDAA